MTASSYKRIIENCRENRSREIRQILELIEHNGEKGSQVETVIAGFLKDLVPRKFSFSTGFVVCRDVKHPQSTQQDVIIHDSLQNSPLYQNENWGIFPIESVYGTVEVKSSLTRASLRKALQDNSAIRRMAEEIGKHYVFFGATEVETGKFIVAEREAESPLSPRFFIVCYQARNGRKDAEFSLVQRWFEELSLSEGAHCHGLLVLSKGWHFHRIAHSSNLPKKFEATESGGVDAFVRTFRANLLSFPMYPANLRKYTD